MKVIAMIPARMGSQRLKKKNLETINGISLIAHVIRKCINSQSFDEIWVNSENDTFGSIAREEGVNFHKRPAELASDVATSEDFVYEFFNNHDCDCLVQVHSIAPLLTISEIIEFTKKVRTDQHDIILSYEPIQIECCFKKAPVNFTFQEKNNSQDIIPVERICWSITSWRKDIYIKSYEEGKCATYNGNIGYHPLSKMASHIIKTYDDLQIARALFNLYN